VEKANEGNYALGGAIFTKDIQRGKKMAHQMKSGMIGINRGPGGAKGSAWVGAGQSGYGFHGSKEGHRQFAQLRIVSSPL
ncbi:MAG: aldehyde dehydrogenase, partial [Bdellovibrionales bacterium]|nr:aldehyde dehydrogenase [Bdellovibrionales bacterium]